MAEYLRKAERYRSLCTDLMKLVPAENQLEAAKIAAKLVNAGMVGSPRAVQSTVRLNYVRAVCQDLPISCNLVETESESGRTFKALVVDGLYDE